MTGPRMHAFRPRPILLICSKCSCHFFCFFQVHVNLMVFEARLQAELLYSLRAVMRHMT